EDTVERLSIKTSHPQWLVELWISDYGYDITKRICESNLTRKPMTIRSQVLKNSSSELLDQLANFDIVATKSPVKKQGVFIEKWNVIKIPILEMGHATIQDESSMLVSEVLNVKPNMTVLDSCSAPGGKATHIAEMMQDKGHL